MLQGPEIRLLTHTGKRAVSVFFFKILNLKDSKKNFNTKKLIYNTKKIIKLLIIGTCYCNVKRLRNTSGNVRPQ